MWFALHGCAAIVKVWQRPTAKHGLALSVCLCVCCYHVCKPCKTAKPIEVPLRGVGLRLAQVDPRNRALDEALIPQKKGVILGVVRPIKMHWEHLQRCIQKQLNRSRCRLGTDLCGPIEAYMEGVKVGRICSPPRGVTIWRCGLLSKFFDHMLPSLAFISSMRKCRQVGYSGAILKFFPRIGATARHVATMGWNLTWERGPRQISPYRFMGWGEGPQNWILYATSEYKSVLGDFYDTHTYRSKHTYFSCSRYCQTSLCIKCVVGLCQCLWPPKDYCIRLPQHPHCFFVLQICHIFTILTVRLYASAVYAVIMCLSLRLAVRLSVCHKSAFNKDR